jgi:eukaryotic-like serine/threonine-protein kinase
VIGTIQEGRYRILRKLGAGGQGEVYLAEHVHLGRHEAIKVLREDVATDADFVSRFRREARATNRVQHPHIVGVYDFGRLRDGRYFLAMEYVDGERLDHVIGGAPMGVKRALRIALQVARALGHAHSMEVVHRDLKPANVILTRHRTQDDVVKVLDFGMAKILESAGVDNVVRTLGGTLLGTGPYMAPEQFLDQAAADPRMDVYGAGVILYEMVTGRTPFDGGMVAQMDQHMRKPPERPSRRQPAAGISRELDELILRALAKRPAERFADGNALAEALDVMIAAMGAGAAVRKTKLGVEVPRPLDDFAGDTDASSPNALGPLSNKTPTTGPSTGTDPGSGVGGAGDASYTTTDRMTRGDAIEIAAAALETVADALLDARVADAGLVAQAAQLRDARRNAARLRAEAVALEARAEALEHSARERQASLSFAIGELTFDRDSGVNDDAGDDVDVQIEALSQSLANLGAETRAALAAIDEQALAVAGGVHDALEAEAVTAAKLATMIGPALAKLEDAAKSAPLAKQLEQARVLLMTA